MIRTSHRSPLRAVPRASLADQAAHALRVYIRENRLPVGSRLPAEPALAAALQVSRNVLRQAVASLQTLGVVRVVQGSGTYITDVGDSRILAEIAEWLHTEPLHEADYFEVRTLWDRAVYALVMERAKPEDLDRIGALAENLAHDPDAPQWVRDHEQFHTAVLDATHNPFLRTVDALLRRLFWEFGYREGPVRKPPPGRLVDSHRQLADLLRSRDPGAIDSMIEVHLAPTTSAEADRSSADRTHPRTAPHARVGGARPPGGRTAAVHGQHDTSREGNR